MSENGVYDVNPDNTYKSIDEQIQLLKDRGLVIENEEFAREVIATNGYTFFVRFYDRLFKESNVPDSNYKQGTSFKEIWAVFEFDRELRALFLEYILAAERKLKHTIAEYFSKQYSPVGYWCEENFSDEARSPRKSIDNSEESTTGFLILKSHIESALEKVFSNSNKQGPIQDYKNREDWGKIPIWLLVNIFSFGMLRTFYRNLKKEDMIQICHTLGVREKEMNQVLFILNMLRNACAHDERIFDYEFEKDVFFGTGNKKERCNGVYAVTKALKKLLSSEQFLSFFAKMNEYVDSLEGVLHTITVGTIWEKMGFDRDRSIIFAEFGSFTNGSILHRDEFAKILTRYILPLIPHSDATIDQDYKPEIEGQKKGRRLTEVMDGYIYFSQSTEANYSARLSIHEKGLDPEVQEIVDRQLSILISNIQIVWNTSRAQNLRPREKEMLFASNAEIAYQLSLCILLCRKNSVKLKESLELRQKEMRMLESKRTENQGALENMSEKIKNIEMEYRLTSEIERAQQETLYSILARMDQWSQKTYEGKHMPFGVIVNHEFPERDKTPFDYIDFLGMNYSATFSDGCYSAVEIYADGSYSGHISNRLSSEGDYTVPYPHQGFAEACKDGKIGVLLTAEGDILIISEGMLYCSKHNGQWNYRVFKGALAYIRNQLDETEGVSYSGKPLTVELCTQYIFQTLVDVSYSHGGACIAIAETNPPDAELLHSAFPVLLDEKYRELVKENCELTDGELGRDVPRIEALRQLVTSNKSFYALNPYLRRELAEMDGALILGRDGTIYAVSAIVRLQGGGVASGGRTTAAKQLSKYGLAIKVSQDGFVKFYKDGSEVMSM